MNKDWLRKAAIVMRTVLKFIHPLLLITVGLIGVAAVFLQGQGGPCASPLILIAPVLLIGALVGLVLSVIRTVRYVRKRDAAKVE